MQSSNFHASHRLILLSGEQTRMKGKGNIFIFFGMACWFPIILVSILISADNDASPSAVNFRMEVFFSFNNPSALLLLLPVSLIQPWHFPGTYFNSSFIAQNTLLKYFGLSGALTEPSSSISHAYPVVYAENDQWHLDVELKIVQRKLLDRRWMVGNNLTWTEYRLYGLWMVSDLFVSNFLD